MSVVLSPAARAALARINNDNAAPRAPSAKKADGSGFGEVLQDALQKAQEAERTADQKAADFAAGEAGIHETIIAQEKAGIAVRYAVTVKNKALEAYREIMNTQV